MGLRENCARCRRRGRLPLLNVSTEVTPGARLRFYGMASWVAVVLPGGGYGPLGAALRFPVLALEAAGARTVTVDYPLSAVRDDHWLSQLRASVDEQVRAGVAEAERVTFVAKSLGTAALAGLAPDAVGGAYVDAVWLTPLFGEAEVRAGAVRHGWRSLLVAGAADGYHRPDLHDAVADALQAESLVLAGSNHALEVPGHPLATVEVMRQLTEAVVRFAGAAPRPQRSGWGRSGGPLGGS